MRRRSLTRWASRLSLVAACTGIVLAAGIETATSARAISNGLVQGSNEDIAGWTMVASSVENTLGAGEGVATVTQLGHGPYELYQGLQSVPDDLKAQGWTRAGIPTQATDHLRCLSRSRHRQLEDVSSHDSFGPEFRIHPHPREGRAALVRRHFARCAMDGRGRMGNDEPSADVSDASPQPQSARWRWLVVVGGIREARSTESTSKVVISSPP